MTQVVPFPTADRPPVLKAYRRALARHAKGGQPGFVSLEGYLAGRLAIAALRDCGPQPDRACFLDRLRRKKEIDLDGFKLRFGASDNQGSDSVFLTVIDRDGRYRPVETLRDSAAQ
ncbi:MAG: ABC transporter substrate-binding protein [Rhodospirillaceae bacterium]|nr:ABC transporter substrate-binding protein [Rhodospirillaceae bacterium]